MCARRDAENLGERERLRLQELRIWRPAHRIVPDFIYFLAGPHPRSLMPRARCALRACGRWHGRRRFYYPTYPTHPPDPPYFARSVGSPAAVNFAFAAAMSIFTAVHRAITRAAIARASAIAFS
jgi:hypothetical protein